MMIDKFLWGAAVSAAQTEGGFDADGRTPSIWDIADPSKIHDGSNCHDTCQCYFHMDEDVRLLKQLGINSYRFSVSWSRVEPELHRFNEKGIEYYSRYVDTLIANGIEPIITLYHWDLPVWAQKKGGWENEEIIGWFSEYVTQIVSALSDRVDIWITMNEPKCFLLDGYCRGVYAPFLKHPWALGTVTNNAYKAHAEAVKVIRNTAKKKPYVGMAMVATAFNGNSEKTFKSLQGILRNTWWMDPVIKQKPVSLRLIKCNEVAESLDFLGLNVYKSMNSEYTKTTALGWPINEQDIYEAIVQFCDRYQLPIIITENGIATADAVADGCVHDTERIDYLSRYISAVRRAINEGCDVRGYMYWSAFDNFEWCEGFNPRFGLIYVDYSNQKRIIKDSGYHYRDLIKQNL